MTAIKPIGQSAETWERRAAAAAADYVRGTQNPKRPWEEATIAAEGNYKAAVIAAANAGAQGRGVRRAGNAKWHAGIERKGEANYTTGVNGAGPDWQKGYSPYQAAIAALTLPARMARGNPANNQRSIVIGQALHQLRIKMV